MNTEKANFSRRDHLFGRNLNAIRPFVKSSVNANAKYFEVGFVNGFVEIGFPEEQTHDLFFRGRQSMVEAGSVHVGVDFQPEVHFVLMVFVPATDLLSELAQLLFLNSRNLSKNKWRTGTRWLMLALIGEIN